MKTTTLKAEKRKLLGRKVKKLREDKILPANVYGKKVASQALQVDLPEFEKVYKEVGETGLVELHINSDKRTVLVHNVQVDPITDGYIHVDFLQVNLKEKVTAQIPIELVGESPAEKQSLGTVVQYMDEVEIEALPADLPEKFEIDISKLEEADQTIYLKDLKYDKKKIEIKEDLEKVIVKVEPLREEKEEEVPAAPGEEGAEAEAKEGAEEKEKTSEEKASGEEKEEMK